MLVVRSPDVWRNRKGKAMTGLPPANSDPISESEGQPAMSGNESAGTAQSLEVDSQETLAQETLLRSSEARSIHEAALSNDAALPATIGRYRVDQLLGKGAFGRVFLGYDDELKRRVAIKVPHRDRIRSEKDIEAYRSEAQILADLDHSAIVPVFDIGHTGDGLCYVVSRYIEGADLAELIKTDRPSFERSASIVAEIAEALHHAHHRGLVHRDVKPANILIDRTGRTFLADFGLAIREDQLGDGSGHAGTPSYMSPEQARGAADRVDGRTDIFSLGVVLYELLTGTKPFKGKTINQILKEIQELEPRPLRQRVDSIPKTLEEICLKCLSKKMSERYTTARDLAEDLKEFLGDATGNPRLPEKFQQAGVASTLHDARTKVALAATGSAIEGKRRKSIVGAAVLVFVALAAVVLPLLPFGNGDESEESPPRNRLLIHDVQIHYQHRGQVGSHDVLDESTGTLSLGDRIQVHLTMNEPAFVCVYWFDEAGAPSRVWPDSLQNQRAVKDLYYPPLRREEEAEEQQWRSISGAPGVDLILVAASVSPFHASVLDQFERTHIRYYFRDRDGALAEFEFGEVRPASDDTMETRDLVIPASTSYRMSWLTSSHLDDDPANRFRDLLMERFDSHHGILFPHK